MSDVLAIIPARHGSKGIPNKNFRLLCGRSPAERAFQVVREAGIRLVAVSSDGPPADWSMPRDASIEAHWIWRPTALAQDETAMIDVVTHALAQIPGADHQIILLVQPTQPLREATHLTDAIALLRASAADSVVSVVAMPSLETCCWIKLSGSLSPLDVYRGPEPCDWSLVPARRQDMGTFYRRDGTVYAFRRDTVTRFGHIYGYDVRPLIIPAEETCGLDTPFDWSEAERRLGAMHA